MADWPSWWPQLTLWYTLFIQFWQSWSKTSWPYMTVIELSITGLKEISVQSQCHPWVKQVLSLKLLILHCKNASESLWFSTQDSRIWNSYSTNSNGFIMLFTTQKWQQLCGSCKYFKNVPSKGNGHRSKQGAVNILSLLKSLWLILVNFSRSNGELFSSKQKEPFVRKQGEVESFSH